MRQALGAVEAAQAVGQVDPVPRLFDGVVGQPALKLAFQDAAGVVGAEFGQRADLDDVLHPGPQARLDRFHFAAFEQIAEAALGRLDGRFVELKALIKVDVLPADRRQFFAQHLPTAPMADQDKKGRGHQHRQNDDQDHHGVHGYSPSSALLRLPDPSPSPTRPRIDSLAAHLTFTIDNVFIAGQF